MGHVASKPDFVAFQQQKCSPACASAQLISAFVIPPLDSLIAKSFEFLPGPITD